MSEEPEPKRTKATCQPKPGKGTRVIRTKTNRCIPSAFKSAGEVVNDDYFTPKHIWEQLVPLLPKDVVYWESFYSRESKGSSGQYLRELGLNVIHEDIDFFLHNKGDIIISNPPFSLKGQVLDRLWELQKPWIMILGSNFLASVAIKRFRHKMSVIVPKRRIQFLDKTMRQTDGATFDCFFFCWNVPGLIGEKHMEILAKDGE